MLSDTISITVNGTARDYKRVLSSGPGIIRRAVITDGESLLTINHETKKGVDRALVKVQDTTTDSTTGEVTVETVHMVVATKDGSDPSNAEKLATDGIGYFLNTAGVMSQILFGEA
jgi:cation transport regulator ChaC